MTWSGPPAGAGKDKLLRDPSAYASDEVFKGACLGFGFRIPRPWVFISSVLFIHTLQLALWERKKKKKAAEVLKSKVVYVQRSECFSYFLQRPRALLSQGLSLFSERVLLPSPSPHFFQVTLPLLGFQGTRRVTDVGR